MTEEQLVAMLKAASEKAINYAELGREAERARLRNRDDMSAARQHYEMMAGIACFSAILLDAALTATRKAEEPVTLFAEREAFINGGPKPDPRPPMCRFRLQEQGKGYPRSGCNACGRTITTGLGKSCHYLEEIKP